MKNLFENIININININRETGGNTELCSFSYVRK